MDVEPSERQINSKSLFLLTDILIPGHEPAWPAASRVLSDPALLVPPQDRELVMALCEELERAAVANRRELVAAFERDHGAVFGRLLRAVYRAYYASGAVMTRVRDIADSAPRETSPHFDPSMLERVMTTQAGKRRL
jgi:hypothetical protein